MNTRTALLLVIFCLLAPGRAWAYRGGYYSGYPYGPPVVVVPAPPAYRPPPPPPPVVVVPGPPVYRPLPPPPPPMVIEYRYYPAWNIYFDPAHGLYWSFQLGAWSLGPLPPSIPSYRLGGYVVVPAWDNRPWMHAPPGYRRW